MAGSRGSTSAAAASLSKQMADLELGEVTLDQLKKFTDNFSEERIIDGFAIGNVWRGDLPKGGGVIAVKELDQEKSPLARDAKVVEKHIMHLQHKHIVQMVAFCPPVETTNGDGSKFFICYKYSPTQTLHKYIKDKGNERTVESWNKRFNIIEGICYGVRYLHTRPVPVLHMDLRPETILLDDELPLPKIADFGLARILPKEQTEKLSKPNIDEQHLYLAPEFQFSGEFSTQSDIYSLGVLILQITTGELKPQTEIDRAARKYIDEIRAKWTLDKIAATYENLSSDLLEEVKISIEVAMECVQIENTRRPSIDTVIDKLTQRRAAN